MWWKLNKVIAKEGVINPNLMANGAQTKLEHGTHHKLAPSLYECFYNTLTICSTFNVDTIIDMMLR
jgi:hypothetical protein